MTCVRLLHFVVVCALVAAPAAAEVYDVDALGIPRFVDTNYIDLAKVTQLSKFRSSAGHDYSDNFESCRSMKHYFMFPDASATLVSPVAGTVTRLMDEWVGTQVQITAAEQPAFTFILFHVQPGATLNVGDVVQEGQVLGTHVGTLTASDIAVRVDTPAGMRLVSYFDTLSSEAFEPFQDFGIASREQLTFTRAERDAAPYRCNGETFVDLAAPPSADFIRLVRNSPPTTVALLDGPLASRTIAARVMPPASVLDRTGSVFVAALFPKERGGLLFFLAASGAWVPYTGCAEAAAYRSGPLQAELPVDVIARPMDLSKHAGVVLYAGYGIGTNPEAACSNMLRHRSFAPFHAVMPTPRSE